MLMFEIWAHLVRWMCRAHCYCQRSQGAGYSNCSLQHHRPLHQSVCQIQPAQWCHSDQIRHKVVPWIWNLAIMYWFAIIDLASQRHAVLMRFLFWIDISGYQTRQIMQYCRNTVLNVSVELCIVNKVITFLSCVDIADRMEVTWPGNTSPASRLFMIHTNPATMSVEEQSFSSPDSCFSLMISDLLAQSTLKFNLDDMCSQHS